MADEDLSSLLDVLKGIMSPEALTSLLGALQGNEAQVPKIDPPGLYWDARHPGGTQKVISAPSAPSPDFYRLVDSLDEANRIFGKGEKPLLYGDLTDVNPETILPSLLRKLQEDQWAAPGGVPLFTDMGVNQDHPGAQLATSMMPLLNTQGSWTPEED